MVQLTNYSLISELAVATSSDPHICNPLFTHSLSLLLMLFTPSFPYSKPSTNAP